MPFAEAPFLFTGRSTTPGIFSMSLHRAQPQTGKLIERSEAHMGHKGIPDERLGSEPIPEDFPPDEFGPDAFKIAIVRLQAQLAVGFSVSLNDDVAPGLRNLVESW